ncbi:MAP7 domain-containing protein 2 isoform X3 [Callorhinchus milii]|uniref:MAP7 domain-containing protein 2 isoform X3 n=1 Tax=Callorhinchus milii TaxID=7868 RepID=UPI001C3F9F02|nr:MAP7 domain-containing protein 2 isoform X3 [Callorhinchus milii]
MAELLTASPRRTVIHTSLKNDERRNQITCRGSPVHIAVIADVQSSKTDDRQRLAKERREEREKSLAAREQQILEKERRAKLLYEKQMEERWKKLDEQRQRDEQRRAAVEEKRRQRFEVERERHEAIMRRTLERSQQLEQRQKRWSWGGAGSTGTGSRDVADRLSASAMNLPKQMDPPVSKRLSSSAAAITHSPERVSHVCPRAVSGSPFKTKSTHSRSGDRQNAGATSTSPGETKGTIFSELQQTEKVKKEKRQSSPSLTSTLRRSQSPANMSKRSSSPAAVKASSKIRTQSPSSGKEYPSSPTSSGKPSPMRQRSSSNAAAETSRKRADKEKGELAKQKSEEAAAGEIKSPDLPGNVTSAPTTPVKEHDKKKIIHAEDTKSMAGTSSAEEATKILAERRRQARLQKELEEQERREQEEAEKKMMEELQRKEAEEEARREEEARQLEEKQKQEEAERQRKAEEEKILREQQEKELLVQLEQQREEAETRAREAAERHRQERELLIQQIEQERFERKKRIEEIMKRTRRSDASEIKKEETKPEIQPTTNEEKLLSTTNTEEQGEKVEVLRTSVSLEIKHEEEPNSTVPPSEAVVQLEEIQEIQLDNIDEQPNSVDESTDELQSMDVSPMSKDDGISIPEFSPLNEVNHGVEMEKDQNGMSDAQAVKDLIDLTGCTTYAKLSSKKINLDDCNRNLIEEQCMSMEENPLITSLTKSVEETHIHTSAEL